MSFRELTLSGCAAILMGVTRACAQTDPREMFPDQFPSWFDQEIKRGAVDSMKFNPQSEKHAAAIILYTNRRVQKSDSVFYTLERSQTFIDLNRDGAMAYSADADVGNDPSYNETISENARIRKFKQNADSSVSILDEHTIKYTRDGSGPQFTFQSHHVECDKTIEEVFCTDMDRAFREARQAMLRAFYSNPETATAGTIHHSVGPMVKATPCFKKGL